MRLVIAVLFLLAVRLVGAQNPDVTQSPPLIAFEEWKKVAESEHAIEYSLSFPSAYTTPEFPINDTVPLRVILPAEAKGPVPVVVLLHYLGATDLKIERSIAEELSLKGLASVIVSLPYHLGRTPTGHMSGELAIQPDPAKLIAVMTQSVLDVRRAMDWIATRPELDSGKIGVGGTSLGALIATLTYALDSRVHRAAFMLSGADLAHILWHSSRVVTQRETLRDLGYTESRLREALKPIEPLEYLPKRTPEITFVIGARHDTVIPPADTEKLIAALGDPKVLWLETGHYGGAFVQRKLLRTIASFFAEELTGKSFEPPRRFYAPTVRVGIGGNAVTGLQVGVGIDIWRSNAQADAYANAMFTPKGAQIFLGRRIDRGFALGVSFTTRGVAPGAFWSTIL